MHPVHEQLMELIVVLNQVDVEYSIHNELGNPTVFEH